MITFLFLLFLSPGLLHAQSKGASPKEKAFQDLLPAGPALNFKRKRAGLSPISARGGFLNKAGFKSRYLERRWQHLHEEGEDLIFLERALLDQFGREGFSHELGQHPYHESPARRFQIIFLLSLPFTGIYSYLFLTILRSLAKSEDSAFTDTERGAFFALALGSSGGIAYYDSRRVQEYKASVNENGIEKQKQKGYEFELWKEKW